VTSPTEFNRGN